MWPRTGDPDPGADVEELAGAQYRDGEPRVFGIRRQPLWQRQPPDQNHVRRVHHE